jgi:hypothetical protein
MEKIAFALCGGAAKGDFEVGAIKYLYEVLRILNIFRALALTTIQGLLVSICVKNGVKIG